MKLMHVRGVALDEQMNPVVVLVDDLVEDRATMALPIWIGQAEATAIAMELQGVKPPRPMTHDLIRSVIQQLEANVHRVVIADIRDATYFAEIHLYRGPVRDQVPADDLIAVDSRPSDAIALALRAGAPIFVDEKVAATAIQLQKPVSAEESQDVLKEAERILREGRQPPPTDPEDPSNPPKPTLH